MRSRIGGLLTGSIVSAVLVTGCGGSAGDSPAPSRAASPGPGPTSPIPTAASPSPLTTQTPLPSATAAVPLGGVPSGCTTSSAIGVADFLTSATSSTSGADACVVGWAAAPPIFGVLPPGIQPQWLWTIGGPFVVWDHSRGPLSDLECSEGKCPPFLMLHVAPGVRLSDRVGWVLLTGHLNDPAAASCHYVYPSDWSESPLPDSQAVALCVAAFVITGISPASPPA